MSLPYNPPAPDVLTMPRDQIDCRRRALDDAEVTATKHHDDEDLFLIELPGGERPSYAICQRIVMVDPDGSRDLPWSELAALFRGKTLRAVPLPGKAASGVRKRHLEAGASTRIGASTRVEVNLVKIERKD